MISKLDRLIAKILPPEDKKFLDVFFIEGAKVTNEAAKLFHRIIISHDHMNESHYVEAKRIKHKSLDITKQTVQALNQTFITPIDREDILQISLLMNKITKRIIRGCVNFKVYRVKDYPDVMRLQSETLVSATEELQTGVSLLRQVAKVQPLSESHLRMVEIERHGDEIFAQGMEELFTGKYDALEVIKLRGIYRDIESAMDNCYSVSDTVLNVVMKNT